MATPTTPDEFLRQRPHSIVIWHKYPDEKPEKKGNYLIKHVDNSYFGPGVTMAEWRDYDEYDDTKVFATGGWTHVVTHWAYMPEGPAI